MIRKDKQSKEPISIQLRLLALKACTLADEIYAELDAYPYDGRVVAGKERALDRIAKHMSDLSGVPSDKFRGYLETVGGTYGQYFDQLRSVGVSIATQDEVTEYESSLNKK